MTRLWFSPGECALLHFHGVLESPNIKFTNILPC
jgi:hypothetical protein